MRHSNSRSAEKLKILKHEKQPTNFMNAKSIFENLSRNVECIISATQIHNLSHIHMQQCIHFFKAFKQ